MSTNTPVANRWTKGYTFTLIAVTIGLILSYLLIVPLPATFTAATVSGSESAIQLGLEADAIRYTTMAEFYAAQAESIQHSLSADAARYTAMAQYYTAPFQRSLDADAARYTAMAEYYMTK